VVGKEVGLEENTEDAKYMVMPWCQENQSMNVGNKPFERVEQLKYLGTTLTNQNCIHEEIKSSLKSGNACYHSVQNLLSSILLSKNIKTEIYRTIILPVVLYAFANWSLTFARNIG